MAMIKIKYEGEVKIDLAVYEEDLIPYEEIKNTDLSKEIKEALEFDMFGAEDEGFVEVTEKSCKIWKEE